MNKNVILLFLLVTTTLIFAANSDFLAVRGLAFNTESTYESLKDSYIDAYIYINHHEKLDSTQVDFDSIEKVKTDIPKDRYGTEMSILRVYSDIDSLIFKFDNKVLKSTYDSFEYKVYIPHYFKEFTIERNGFNTIKIPIKFFNKIVPKMGTVSLSISSGYLSLNANSYQVESPVERFIKGSSGTFTLTKAYKSSERPVFFKMDFNNYSLFVNNNPVEFNKALLLKKGKNKINLLKNEKEVLSKKIQIDDENFMFDFNIDAFSNEYKETYYIEIEFKSSFDRKPELDKDKEFRYLGKAKGEISVTYTIQKDGSISEPVIKEEIKGNPDEVNDRFIEFLKANRKFSPAQKNGEAIECKVIEKINFKN